MRAMYCDILGRSDDEFWRSNQREIGERINFYLETKGLKDTPILVKNDFDDDEDIYKIPARKVVSDGEQVQEFRPSFSMRAD